jgi:hypothetical protein
VVDSLTLQHEETLTVDRYPTAKRCDGAVVTDAFPNASDLQ